MASIYKLTHPTSSKIYIGKTCRSLKRRLWGHMYESKKHPYLRKSKWIQSLVKNGLSPEINLIEEVVDERCDEREKYHIAKGWENFPDDMLNSPLMPGGEGFSKGCNLSKESRNNSSLHSRKLKNEDLVCIANRINKGEYIKDIAEEYGINRVTITRNLNGRVIGTDKIDYRTNMVSGTKHHLSKITSKIADEIRRRYSIEKIRQKDLAKEYEISQASIWSIIQNKTWKELK